MFQERSSSFASTLAVPAGRSAKVTQWPFCAEARPFTISLTVPSPPHAMINWRPSSRGEDVARFSKLFAACRASAARVRVVNQERVVQFRHWLAGGHGGVVCSGRHPSLILYNMVPF